MRSAVAFFVPYLHLIRTVNMVEEICDRYVATLHHLAAVECCCNNTSRCRLVKPPLIVTPITLLFVYSFKLSPPFLFYCQDLFQQPKLNCIYQSHFRPKMGYFSLVILNVDLLMWPSPTNLTWLWSMFTAVWNIFDSSHFGGMLSCEHTREQADCFTWSSQWHTELFCVWIRTRTIRCIKSYV